MVRLRLLALMVFFFVVDRNGIQILRFKYLTTVQATKIVDAIAPV